ncbi:MAG: HD domain-containing protein [Pseudomonadota bacterium]
MSHLLRRVDPTEGPFHPSLEETAAFAANAHAGQTDKAGEPYFKHLARVVSHLQRLFPFASNAERHAAWLHDIIEDTSITINDLRELRYAEEVLALVRALTRPEDPGTSYAEWIASLAESGDARVIRVKIADLTDNTSAERLEALPADQRASLAQRYQKALQRLQGALESPLDQADDEGEDMVMLGVSLPAMDLWTIEEAARIADRTTNEFVAEEMSGLAYRITGEGSIRKIKLQRDYAEDTRAFIEAFAASERKHVPVAQWAAQQVASDVTTSPEDASSATPPGKKPRPRS